MIICKYAIEVLWLVLAVSTCWINEVLVSRFGMRPNGQEDSEVKPQSPAQIRPPPWFG